jgi:DNA-directed RNA polymerase alpha subunit
MMEKKCSKGHTFYKSSNCQVCPVCEKKRQQTMGFLSLLAAPARRALENEGITTLVKLAAYSEKELLRLHGLGKTSLPILKKALSEKKNQLKQG